MENYYDIIIIGGGPAGLTAAIYANRAGYRTILLEKIGFGGQMALSDTIDNYPGFLGGISGYELQEKMLKHAQKFNLQSEFTEVKKIEKKDKYFTVLTDRTEYQCTALIIASGAKHRELNVKGEHEFASKGVSYCATCDGPLFKNKKIFVIGGGDTAILEAAFLSKFANSLKIIHRRERFRAVKALTDQTDQIKNIEYVFDTVVEEIKGENFVQKAVLKNLKTNEVYEEAVDGIFVLIGILPNTDFVDPKLLDTDRYILTDMNMATKIEGLFAAGDVRSNAFRQVVCATGDGAMAAYQAGHYVDKMNGMEYH